MLGVESICSNSRLLHYFFQCTTHTNTQNLSILFLFFPSAYEYSNMNLTFSSLLFVWLHKRTMFCNFVDFFIRKLNLLFCVAREFKLTSHACSIFSITHMLTLISIALLSLNAPNFVHYAHTLISIVLLSLNALDYVCTLQISLLANLALVLCIVKEFSINIACSLY
jgi:hypothetical protein